MRMTTTERQLKKHILIAYSLMLSGIILSLVSNDSGVLYVLGFLWALYHRSNGAQSRYRHDISLILHTFWLSMGVSFVCIILIDVFLPYLVLIILWCGVFIVLLKYCVYVFRDIENPGFLDSGEEVSRG